MKQIGEKVSAHIIVSGYVQGVGYRWSVMKRAPLYHLTGYVKNLHNGDVEVWAEGEKQNIEELIEFLKVGPRSAEVTGVKVKWDEATGYYHNFDVKY